MHTMHAVAVNNSVSQQQRHALKTELHRLRCLIVHSRAFRFGQKKFRFDSILATESIFSIRFDSPICRFYTDIRIVVMVSLVKGLAAFFTLWFILCHISIN